MSLLSRLFGGKSEPNAAETLEYKGFRIKADPKKEDQGYRLCAVIEKEVGGELKAHTLIRADVINDVNVCADASVQKAKQMIDQMGERLF